MLSQKYGIIESYFIEIINIEGTYVTPFYPVIVYLIFNIYGRQNDDYAAVFNRDNDYFIINMYQSRHFINKFLIIRTRIIYVHFKMYQKAFYLNILQLPVIILGRLIFQRTLDC